MGDFAGRHYFRHLDCKSPHVRRAFNYLRQPAIMLKGNLRQADDRCRDVDCDFRHVDCHFRHVRCNFTYARFDFTYVRCNFRHVTFDFSLVTFDFSREMASDVLEIKK